MIYVLHHFVTFGMAVSAMWWLPRGRWTHASPRTALVLWQLVLCAGVVSAIGLLFELGLEPYHLGVLPGLARVIDEGHVPNPVILAATALTAWLVVSLIRLLASTARTRARHRGLLALVARTDGDALVLDHSAAVAYCLPGRQPRIVISAGARELLTDDELRAVLAHERAHLRQRHHLVLEPFQAWRMFVPRRALAAIGLLVEMCADESAARRHGRAVLASALEKFGTSAAPAGGLAAGSVGTLARIERLRHPRPAAALGVRLLAVATALAALLTPLTLFVWPA